MDKLKEIYKIYTEFCLQGGDKYRSAKSAIGIVLPTLHIFHIHKDEYDYPTYFEYDGHILFFDSGSIFVNTKDTFSFSGEATSTDQYEAEIGISTDGIGIFQDDAPHKAYTMELGKKYLVTIKEIK